LYLLFFSLGNVYNTAHTSVSVALNQNIIQKVLNKEILPGKMYKVKELIQLFENTGYEFDEWAAEPLKSEPNRPRWHRLVTNAVRLCPGRDDYPENNSWTKLKVIKRKRNYLYYKLAEDKEEMFLVNENDDDDGSGTIYSITNEAWGNWIKIGKSIDFKRRLISYQTYSPLKDYRKLHSINVKNRDIAEGQAHRIASNYSHYEPQGEWFHITEKQAKETLNRVKEIQSF